MVTQKDYPEALVRAARSVLVELVHLLREYWENIVLVGGWVPELLLSTNKSPHIGSIDVDLALNHLKLQDEGYKSIQANSLSSIVPFLVMKGMALDDRLKEKDAWDIYYCIQNYPGGLDHLIGEFRSYIEHGLVKEGLEKIAKHFASEKHVGPRFVADFEEITAPPYQSFNH